jgi:hypothetical protein
MKYEVIDNCTITKRSLVFDGQHYGLVMKLYDKGTQVDLDIEKIWAMPSLLFGFACLYETDLPTAIENLLKEDKKWSY